MSFRVNNMAFAPSAPEIITMPITRRSVANKIEIDNDQISLNELLNDPNAIDINVSNMNVGVGERNAGGHDSLQTISLKLIQGPPGVPGRAITGPQGDSFNRVFFNNKHELCFENTDGTTHNVGKILVKDGKEGKEGPCGKDGRGILSIDNKHIYLTDGTKLSSECLRGPRGYEQIGPTGRGILYIDEKIIKYTDGSAQSSECLRGPIGKGQKGDKGDSLTGPVGKGIVQITSTDIIFSDGTTQSSESLRGPRGFVGEMVTYSGPDMPSGNEFPYLTQPHPNRKPKMGDQYMDLQSSTLFFYDGVCWQTLRGHTGVGIKSMKNGLVYMSDGSTQNVLDLGICIPGPKGDSITGRGVSQITEEYIYYTDGEQQKHCLRGPTGNGIKIVKNGRVYFTNGKSIDAKEAGLMITGCEGPRGIGIDRIVNGYIYYTNGNRQSVHETGMLITGCTGSEGKSIVGPKGERGYGIKTIKNGFIIYEDGRKERLDEAVTLIPGCTGPEGKTIVGPRGVGIQTIYVSPDKRLTFLLTDDREFSFDIKSLLS